MREAIAALGQVKRLIQGVEVLGARRSPARRGGAAMQ